MKTIFQTSIALAAAALILTTTASRAGAAVLAYSLANNGTTLISFDLATPGVTTAVGVISGAVTRLDGIDFRPFDGLLYGYSQPQNVVVTINLNNASTSLASTPTTGSTTTNLGIDFNPAADRLRVVNSAEQNLRMNVATGATLVDGSLAYAAGDANFGINPSINEAAYTNSDINPATGTTLFYIDSNLGILVTTSNPNAGLLNTVGSLGVTTSDLTGFDILSDGFGSNTLYALLTNPNGIASLYTVNASTGAATSVGVISQTAAARPYSLAIVQPKPVPEPSSCLMACAMSVMAGGVAAFRKLFKNSGIA